ncbi:conserved hypothetical protein [Microsporum canis CBS 113480]|uniref:Uncharacterized protein n=1 Tax=Arthroderma otae (strain ATCC MYA-4605 / CBS 113480) TaxID=554155 RepID=C5FJ42_ARTOC|nr:conserved hypothetical protein [Microsporum canis CBS 113480]EEQ29372.1 conserved hypothetical protein [Microsporum canis CBS 113480]
MPNIAPQDVGYSVFCLFVDVLIPVRADSIWGVSIWIDPAPPPDEGPPISASAIRDTALLWREIVAIVAAYIAVVSLLLGCLLTVGRRLRRGAQESNGTLEMDLVKPSAGMMEDSPAPVEFSTNNLWPSPMSPTTQSNVWPSPPKSKARSFNLPWSSSHSNRAQSAASIAGSVSTVDESVVQADRVKAQEEMERLYAAVMEHDARKSAMSQETVTTRTTPPSPLRSPVRLNPLEGPPEFRHLRRQQQPMSPVSPSSPLSACHLPTVTEFEPQHHSSLPFQEEPASKESPISPRAERFSRLSQLSFLSSRSKNSTSSPKKLLGRSSLRGLHISSPMGSPELNSRDYLDRQPLSPRTYNPGPPPLTPHEQAKLNSPQPNMASPSFITSPPSKESLGSRKFRATPPSLNINTAQTSTPPLPFRVAYDSPMSAPSTKTTIVERRPDLLHGPRTGVPRTPYSPYMPFTPITPLTPSHIVTRQERKQRQKRDGPRVLMEEDLVKSDEDMWS